MDKPKHRVMDPRAPEDVRKAFESLESLEDHERQIIFAQYCRECGSKDARCQCWNDE